MIKRINDIKILTNFGEQKIEFIYDDDKKLEVYMGSILIVISKFMESKFSKRSK